MSDITKKRPFIISRASFAGQGVYSGHWSGDITSNWDDLRYTIPGIVTFSSKSLLVFFIAYKNSNLLTLDYFLSSRNNFRFLKK